MDLAEHKEGTFARRTGEPLLGATVEMFRLWDQVRNESLSRAAFRRAMKPLEARVFDLIDEGYRSPCKILHGKCKDLRQHKDALFTFVRVEGIEPTNNAAERALRHGVILRKTSFGTHSPRGSRFVERILTVTETLPQQGRDPPTRLRRGCRPCTPRTSTRTLPSPRAQLVTHPPG